jgi:hypothetical protein
MTTECNPAVSTDRSTDTLPALVDFVVVQGIGFRCVAYRDAEGCWHNAFNNEELFGEIHILE